MIKSFADKETEKIFNGEFSKKLPVDIQKTASRKLSWLNVTNSLNELAMIPANRLESLVGNKSGQWSIRINNQWRITFTPINGGKDYINVKIEDYH